MGILLKLVVASKKGKQLGGKWVPNINFAELLGWGINTHFRKLLFYNMLTWNNYPDPFQQNWLLTNGSQVCCAHVWLPISKGQLLWLQRVFSRKSSGRRKEVILEVTLAHQRSRISSVPSRRGTVVPVMLAREWQSIGDVVSK